MDYQQKKELLKKYSEQQLTGSELAQFYELLNSGAFDQDYERIMSELEEENKELFLIPAESRRRVKARLDSSLFPSKKKSIRWIWQVASVAAVIMTFFTGYHLWKRYEYEQLTHSFITVDVPQGQVFTIDLKDGTKVTLSPGAKFKYPKLFERDARQVYLEEGRAFFDVAKDKTKPFTVHADRLATTALGTSFVVQNYKDYKFEKVSLYTGMVKVKFEDETNKEVVLRPGEEFEKDGQGANGHKKFDLKKDPMLSGGLEFNNERMEEVLYNISNRYQVHLDFNPEQLNSLFVTGTYRQADVAEVLKSIAFTHRLTIKKLNENSFSIMKK